MDPQQQHTSGTRPAGTGGRMNDWEEGPVDEGNDRSPTEAFKEAGTHFNELKEYATHYVAAKADAMKASVRNLGLYAALGVVGALVGGAIVVTAGVLLMIGLAGAIGAIFEPDMPWVGHLAVGLIVLGGIGVGTMVFLKKFTAGSRERTVKKYESREQQQRVQFGHDVHERARQAEREA